MQTGDAGNQLLMQGSNGWLKALPVWSVQTCTLN